MSNTTFSGNTATYGLGGAIDNSGSLTVNYSSFTGGVAFEGGAIDNKDGGTLVVNDSTFDSNDAIQGGSLYNESTRDDHGQYILELVCLPGRGHRQRSDCDAHAAE